MNKNAEDKFSEKEQNSPFVPFSKIIIEVDNESFGLEDNKEYYNRRQKTFCAKRQRHISTDNAMLLDRAKIT